MATFIIYTIRWAMTLTLLYSLYRLLLQRETFHCLNRAVLLAILMLSPLLPLLPLHTDEPTAMDEMLTQIERPLLSRSPTESIAQDSFAAQEAENDASGLWVRYCAYLYIIGVAVALAVYMFRLLTLLRVMSRSRRISHPIVPKDAHLMLDMRIQQPSSWMRWIFIGPIDLKQNAEAVLKHELAHVRMGHSWDVILCDITCHLLWCLPFVWMLRQDLVDVHEFQADDAVLQSGVTLENYEHLLVRKAVQAQFLPIVNTLRREVVKKRFAMMYKSRSPRWKRLKLLYLAPALAACLWVSAQAEVYKTYLNGKLAIQEDPQTVAPYTIKHVNVNHSQKRKGAYYDLSDQAPQFPGGDAAMQQYLSQHLRYPDVAFKNGVEGIIVAEFTVEADGSITGVKTLEPAATPGKGGITDSTWPARNDVTALAQKEGIRALQEFTEELIRGMPPFEPGRHQGKAVRAKVSLPVTFKLD